MSDADIQHAIEQLAKINGSQTAIRGAIDALIKDAKDQARRIAIVEAALKIPPPPPPPPPTGGTAMRPQVNMTQGQTIANVVIDGANLGANGAPSGSAGIFIGDGIGGCTLRDVTIRNCKFGINRHPGAGPGTTFERVTIEDTYDSGVLDQGIIPAAYTDVRTLRCGVNAAGENTAAKYGGDPQGVHGWYLKSRSTLIACRADHSQKQGFSIRTTGVSLIDCAASDAAILVSWHDYAGSRGPQPWGPIRVVRFNGLVRGGGLGMYCEPSNDRVPSWVVEGGVFTAAGAGARGIDLRGHDVAYSPQPAFNVQPGGTWSATVIA